MHPNLHWDPHFYNLSFGFATKVRACKSASQERSLRVTFHAPGSVRECEGMNSHTPKWELNSQWTPKFLEGNYSG
jgi:hypothetical protein